MKPADKPTRDIPSQVSARPGRAQRSARFRSPAPEEGSDPRPPGAGKADHQGRRPRAGRSARWLAALVALHALGCASAPPDEGDAAETGRGLLFPGQVEQAGGPAGGVALADPAWIDAGQMLTARGEHTATLLDDGRVLIAGGLLGLDEGIVCDPAFSQTYLDSAEIYDHDAAVFVPAAPMSRARIDHTATRLPDGRVLAVGGLDAADSAEIYDPALDVWQPAAPPLVARARHAATRLLDGRVLVTGGVAGEAQAAAVELYDPTTEAWTAGPPMAAARGPHRAVLLLDGRVLVTGGAAGELAGRAEIFDPATASWSLTAARDGVANHLTATLLQDGRVLATGRDGVAEVYDPVADTWTAAPGKLGDTPPSGSIDDFDHVYSHGVLGEAAAPLPDGQVMISGGIEAITYMFAWGGTICSTAYLEHAHNIYGRVQTYDPASNAWSPASWIPARGYHTATPLQDGAVLVAGGYTYAWSYREVESTASALVHGAPRGDGARCSRARGATPEPSDDVAPTGGCSAAGSRDDGWTAAAAGLGLLLASRRRRTSSATRAA
ncbi:hypothetical protein WME91_42385 [Sorangium sp. So ce269]